MKPTKVEHEDRKEGGIDLRVWEGGAGAGASLTNNEWSEERKGGEQGDGAPHPFCRCY